MMTDEVVRNLIEESTQDIKTIRSLAQVFLSIMEVQGITDLRDYLGEDMCRPEVLQALEIAKAAYSNQGIQSVVLRRPEQHKPGPLAGRIRIGKT